MSSGSRSGRRPTDSTGAPIASSPAPATDGRPGVHGIAIDPATHRAFVSSVGRLPRPLGLRQLPAAADGSRRSRSSARSMRRRHWRFALPQLNSGALGDYMAGAPAIAARAGAGRHAAGGRSRCRRTTRSPSSTPTPATLLRTIPLGVEPIAAVISRRRRVGIRHRSSADRSRRAASARRSSAAIRAPSAVRVDARGIAAAGQRDARRSRRRGTVARDIAVGRHPDRARVGRVARRVCTSPTATPTPCSVIDTRATRVVAHFRRRAVPRAHRSAWRRPRSPCRPTAARCSSRSAARMPSRCTMSRGVAARRALQRAHSHRLVSVEPRRERRRAISRGRHAVRRRARAMDDRRAGQARPLRASPCAARSTSSPSRPRRELARVHDGRERRTTSSRSRRRRRRDDRRRASAHRARRSRASGRSVAHQPRRVHRQRESHLRSGARRPRSRRARQLARHVRPRRHAQRARARPSSS